MPTTRDTQVAYNNKDNTMEIKAQHFVTSTGRRVLTDNGKQPGIGSTTEKQKGRVAEAIFANCAELDFGQIDEIIEWLRLYQR